MVDFPDEIIIDILSRVPAKTVGRCRCVSKPWKFLLIQPQFIKTHLNKTQTQHSEQQSLILQRNDYGNDYVYGSLYSVLLSDARNMVDETTVVAAKLDFVDHLFTDTVPYIAPSCNGLILIGVSETEGIFYFINPATKQTKHLPYITSPYCFSSYGVGYDSMSDDYKVVVIFSCDPFVYTDCEDEEYKRERIERVVYIYSLRNDAWKTAESLPHYSHLDYGASGLCVDRCIHWSVTRTKGLSKSCVILAFDLHDDKFHEIQSISSEDIHYPDMHVMRYGGCLCVWYFLRKGTVELWKMEEYGVQESWIKYFIKNPDEGTVFPICFMAKDHLLMSKFVRDRQGVQELVVYNLKDGTFKDIGLHVSPDCNTARHTFIESLVSPHYGNGAA